jgi:hypothetical protein
MAMPVDFAMLASIENSFINANIISNDKYGIFALG